MKNKSDVFQIFLQYQKHVKRLLNKNIVSIQTDWGGEYQKLNIFFNQTGITHRLSCPHTHQQNEATKRKHRHLIEVSLSLLAHASMPLKF